MTRHDEKGSVDVGLPTQPRTAMECRPTSPHLAAPSHKILLEEIVTRLKKEGSAADADCCELLRSLIENGGFFKIANYIDEEGVDWEILQAFLERPKANTLLEAFMARKNDASAFPDQQITLQPEPLSHVTDCMSAITIARQPRDNITILLGHYYTSKVYLLHRLSLACLKAATLASQGDLPSAKNQFHYARQVWQILSVKQKEFFLKQFEQTPPLLITHIPSSEEEFIAAQQPHNLKTLFLTGLKIHLSCQRYLQCARKYNDLQALDIEITMLNARIKNVSQSITLLGQLTPKNLPFFVLQLRILKKLLDEQFYYAELAKKLHPGPGHIHFAIYTYNEKKFHQLFPSEKRDDIQQILEQYNSSIMWHLCFALQNKRNAAGYWHNGMTDSTLFKGEAAYKALLEQAQTALDRGMIPTLRTAH